MGLFDEWWDAANSLDRDKMGALLDDDFTLIRHNKGDILNKEEFLDYLMTGIRDQVTCQDRRLIYENDNIDWMKKWSKHHRFAARSLL